MDAIKLTREVYGCSLTDAVKYVEQVQSGKKSSLGKA
jgi:ribosomal protein L7/L12